MPPRITVSIIEDDCIRHVLQTQLEYAREHDVQLSYAQIVAMLLRRAVSSDKKEQCQFPMI